MSKMCAKTCDRCDKPATLSDLLTRNKSGGWLRGFPSIGEPPVTLPTLCIDKVAENRNISECRTFSHRCKSPRWEGFMIDECPVTCDACG